jgi:putative Holliday junction resolvase
VALSDPDGVLASPLTIINRTDIAADIDAIIGIISQHQVKQIIVGMPRTMDGSLGVQAEKVIAFIHRLSGDTKVPVESRDERLTTAAAKRLMHTVNKKKSRQRARDDAIAAAIILQGYLDEKQ